MEATVIPTGAARRRPTDVRAEEPPRPKASRIPEAIADPAPLGLAAFALTTFMHLAPSCSYRAAQSP